MSVLPRLSTHNWYSLKAVLREITRISRGINKEGGETVGGECGLWIGLGGGKNKWVPEGPCPCPCLVRELLCPFPPAAARFALRPKSFALALISLARAHLSVRMTHQQLLSWFWLGKRLSGLVGTSLLIFAMVAREVRVLSSTSLSFFKAPHMDSCMCFTSALYLVRSP
jgi:hypothetical protein